MANISEVLSELMAKPYRKTITRTPEGTFLGEIPELPGCITEGDSEIETIALLNDAMREWLRTALELGRPIPGPFEVERAFSGKFNLRVPRSLHRELKTRAQENGVSLNEYCVLLLAEGVNQNPVLPIGTWSNALSKTAYTFELIGFYISRQHTLLKSAITRDWRSFNESKETLAYAGTGTGVTAAMSSVVGRISQ